MQIHDLPFLSTGGGISDPSLLVVSKEEKTYKYTWSAIKDQIRAIANSVIASALATGGAISSAINTRVTEGIDEALATGGAIKNAIASARSGSIVFKTYYAEYTVGANSAKILTASELGVTTPTGYTPLSVRGWSTGATGVLIQAIQGYNTGSGNFIAMRNITSNAVTATCNVTVAYIKNDMV